MTNDRVAHYNGPISITASTPAAERQRRCSTPTGYIVYTPNPGFSGTDTFTYTITDAVGTSSTATVTMTVLAKPEVSVSNATVMEGNAGESTVTVNVKLSNQSLETGDRRLPDGQRHRNAPAPTTSATSGSLTFAPLTTTMPITVQVIGDTLAEAHEKFIVRVSSPTNARDRRRHRRRGHHHRRRPARDFDRGHGVDHRRQHRLDNVAMNVTLSQSHDRIGLGQLRHLAGDRPRRERLQPHGGTLQFLPGMTTKTIYVPVIYDTVGEPPRSFYVD